MPLYFFDIDETIVDEQGVDLPDLASAQAYAAGVASTFPVRDNHQRHRRIVVRTEAGKVLDPPDNTWAAAVGSGDERLVP